MKILVTGGAGFIGSHVADLLVKEGHSVVIVDNLSSGSKDNINPRAKFYHQDLGNWQEIEKIFLEEEPEIVYHLAAQIDVRKSVENPAEDARINILNSINLLELCRKNNVKHFIFSSTGGAIYGEDAGLPTKEGEKESPISPYGIAKLAIEKYLHFYWKVYNLKYTCLRYSNVYGPRQGMNGEAGVISIFLNKMFRNETPVIFGGIQTRDFVFVEDVARANLLALQDAKSDTYNIGTGKEIDVISLFSKLNTYFKNNFVPEFREMRAGEQLKSCLDYEYIKTSLGWETKISLNDGMDRTYCWFLKQRGKLI